MVRPLTPGCFVARVVCTHSLRQAGAGWLLKPSGLRAGQISAADRCCADCASRHPKLRLFPHLVSPGGAVLRLHPLGDEAGIDAAQRRRPVSVDRSRRPSGGLRTAEP